MRSSTNNLINDIVSSTVEKGIVQLITEDKYYDGNSFTINGKTLVNFASCGYLGLELDKRLKKAAKESIDKYGIQFSSSRTYVACTQYSELEFLTRQIFNAPVLFSTSVSLGHHGVLPVIIDDKDAVILDQQVHASVQDAAYKLRTKGVTITIIRHNDLNELQSKVNELSQTHSKVWYMIDGVYSMYGDFAPITPIAEMLDNNKKLHLYADDAHGISWYGEHGKGYILHQIGNHPKMVVAASLNKAFGAGGGAFIFPNEEIYRKVKNCGGPFMFSGPHQIPTIGAAIASAKIHLSDEIYEKQKALAKRIAYCHQLLEEHHLPVISSPETPIFFVGLGLLRVGHNLVKRMMSKGFYVNIANFPAVPENCTGIRFTITLHHSYKDIEKMVKTLSNQFNKALEEEERTIEDVHRAFKKIKDFNHTKSEPIRFHLTHETSIKNISKDLWDQMMQGRGNFDYNSLCVLEESFKHNPNSYNNMDFHYFIVKDQFNKPVVATFFSISITKDDLLAPEEISGEIEKIRSYDPYYLTTRSIIMGTSITEGDHLYIDRTYENWKKALMMVIDAAWKEQDSNNAGSIIIRDLNKDDTELCEFMKQQGFIMADMPEAHLLNNFRFKTIDTVLERSHGKKRYFLKNNVLNFENHYEITITRNPTTEEIDSLYQLYLNTTAKNLKINVFTLPKRLFSQMAKSGKYEFILLKLKPEFDSRENRPFVGMAVNYQSSQLYCFLLTGLDYTCSIQHNTYSQVIWQVIKRANDLNVNSITLGYTASVNKRKFGATTEQRALFVQHKDNFNMILIESMSKSIVRG